jgi:hypothetical protein
MNRILLMAIFILFLPKQNVQNNDEFLIKIKMVFSKNESDFADYYYFKGDSSQLDIFFKDKYTSINDFNYKKKKYCLFKTVWPYAEKRCEHSTDSTYIILKNDSIYSYRYVSIPPPALYKLKVGISKVNCQEHCSFKHPYGDSTVVFKKNTKFFRPDFNK